MTEKNIDKIALVAGGIAVVMVVLLLPVVPKKWAIAVGIVLTAIGVPFGFLTFVL